MSDGMTDKRGQYSDNEKLNMLLSRINDRHFSSKNTDDMFLALATLASTKPEFKDMTVAQVKQFAIAASGMTTNINSKIKRGV